MCLAPITLINESSKQPFVETSDNARLSSSMKLPVIKQLIPAAHHVFCFLNNTIKTCEEKWKMHSAQLLIYGIYNSSTSNLPGNHINNWMIHSAVMAQGFWLQVEMEWIAFDKDLLETWWTLPWQYLLWGSEHTYLFQILAGRDNHIL